MNENTKAFLSANWFKLILTLVAVAALCIYAYQTFVVLPKQKAEAEFRLSSEKLEKENKKITIKQKLGLCKALAGEAYNANWATACKSRSLKADCSLPMAVAESLNKSLKNSTDDCYKEFKIDMEE